MVNFLRNRNILGSQDKFVFWRASSTFQILLSVITYLEKLKVDGVCAGSRKKKQEKKRREERVGEEKEWKWGVGGGVFW